MVPRVYALVTKLEVQFHPMKSILSRGASRSPSPFSLPSGSSASSAATGHSHLGNHVQQSSKYAGSKAGAENFMWNMPGVVPDLAPREEPEMYSRKVFVGGLLNIDQGLLQTYPYAGVIYLSSYHCR